MILTVSVYLPKGFYLMMTSKIYDISM